MRGKPIELERLDMGQRSRVGQPGNVGNGRVRAQIEKDALALKVPCPSLREPNFDCLGSDEAAFAKNEVQTVDRKPRLVGRDQPSTMSRLRCRTPAISTVQGPTRNPNGEAWRTRSATFAL
jgi:hypothetical protein